MSILRHAFIRTTRPVCPACYIPMVIGDIYYNKDKGEATLCGWCGSLIGLQVICKIDGVHVHTKIIDQNKKKLV